MNSTNSDLKPCTRCKTAWTTLRIDDKPVCSACKAMERRGEIVELTLDLTKVKQSTYLQIQALIQKDMEEAENKQAC